MARTRRIIARLALKTVADRRARLKLRTLPEPQTEFTPEEHQVFDRLDRRHRSRW